MKTNQTKQSCIDKFILNKWNYVIITLVFVIIEVVLFGWATKINLKSPINYSLFGAFGDFIGGVLGTVLTVLNTLLLVRTFLYQQSVTKSNERQLETQRFNNLFFELMNLYHKEVAELCGQDFNLYRRTSNQEDNSEFIERELRYDDKDFFDVSKEKLQQSYQNGNSFLVNRKLALSLYMDFYIKNKTKMGAYFRTLYRIYDLIDNADLEESSKKNYLKIVRAQLTESELFFLRYNAMTYYGNNFIKYINKYNILKHLPAFELLEFKDWWNKSSQIENTGINIIFDSVGRKIRDMLCDSQQSTRTIDIKSFSPKYAMRIEKKSPYDLLITVVINKTAINDKDEFSALDNFDNKKIQQLLDCFIKEVVIYSNFERYNTTKELDAYSSPIIEDTDTVTINSGIRNKERKPLKVTSDFFQTI